ncbi:uncharacterized protein LOC112679701 [Sipha flava]|uniref:Uncharacterized protein LOC112679701 n=1 Tax=Sipha flava TaxID=143950 RepID=A0A8B8F3L0_9HEMI|nr:uncharacterized protein LOC112679701 [Sipha flava]
MEADGCAVCGAPAAQRCANCLAARYCGRAHQRAHWTEGGHKSACRPYVVASSPELGRHWVTVRDVAVGEVLLEERPLAVGPKAGSPPVCLTCYAPATGHACSGCGWPVCGPRCEAAPVHRLAECSLVRGHFDERHLSAKQLKNNTKICEELLRLADVLEPGITRFRGLLLFYLVCGLKKLKRIKKKSNYDEIIKNYTEKSVAIFKTEPDLDYLIDRLQ